MTTPLLLLTLATTAFAPAQEGPASPDRVEFVRNVERLVVGQRVQLEARAVAEDGTPLPDRIAWRASSSSYVSLAADGRITAITPGEVTIMAIAGNVEESFTLEVIPNRLEAVSLAPSYQVARVGEELRLDFRALEAGGSEVDGIAPTWELTSDLDATIHDDGRFVARQPGLHTVVATVGDRKAIATVRVAPR